jgi:hypothetical protein
MLVGAVSKRACKAKNSPNSRLGKSFGGEPCMARINIVFIFSLYNKPVMILKILLIGWIVLIGAIILNGLAGLLGLATWYTFLAKIAQQGWLPALRQTPIISHLFLFVIYPLALGGLAWLGLRLIRFW